MSASTLLRKLALTTVAGLVAVGLVLAGEPRPPAVVIRICSGCHGMDGRPQLSYVPVLAGQNPKYIEGKLQKFRQATSPPVDEALKPLIHFSRSRSNGAITAAAATQMIGIAKSLSDSDSKAAAAWYSAQTPLPAKSKKGSAFQQGQDLYAHGRPTQNLPACQICHGPEGQGTAAAPRLAGQQREYVLAQLNEFRSGAEGQSPMTQIARSLDKNQMQAIAEYLHSR